jgi:hypothetical protein
VEDTIHILEDIAIPESPQNDEILSTQPSISFFIVVFLIRMLAAVDLDNQPSFETNKICNIISQWLLPAKLEPTNLPKPKPLPKQPLDLCWVPSQSSSSQASLVHIPLSLPFPAKGERNNRIRPRRMIRNDAVS